MIVHHGSQEIAFRERMSVDKLLRKLEVNPLTVVVVRNGTMVTRDQMLEVGDEVELVRVISGGRQAP